MAFPGDESLASGWACALCAQLHSSRTNCDRQVPEDRHCTRNKRTLECNVPRQLRSQAPRLSLGVADFRPDRRPCSAIQRRRRQPPPWLAAFVGRDLPDGLGPPCLRPRLPRRNLGAEGEGGPFEACPAGTRFYVALFQPALAPSMSAVLRRLDAAVPELSACGNAGTEDAVRERKPRRPLPHQTKNSS